MIDTSIMLCKCNHIVFSAKWLRRENVETDIFGGIEFGSLDGRKNQSAAISLVFTFLFEKQNILIESKPNTRRAKNR